MVTIGQRIADIRKSRGITQEELAHRVGYQTKSAINKIEMGLREVPQKKIEAFASALDVTPGRLMGWNEETKKAAPEGGLSKSKMQLLALAENCTEEDAEKLLQMMQILLGKQ